YAPTLVVLFDGDAAGKKATLAVREPAKEAGLLLKVARVPAGTDPDALSQEKGIGAVQALVKNAKGMLEYLIDSTLSDARGASMREIQERLNTVARYLSEEADPNLRTMGKIYADRLSAQLVVDGQSPEDLRGLERMVSRALAGGPKAASKASERSTALAPPELGPRARSRPDEHRLALDVLGALIDVPELFNDVEVEDGLVELSGDIALAAVTLREVWEAKNALGGAELLDLLPQAIHSFAVGRLAAPRYAEAEEAKAVVLENLRKIRYPVIPGDIPVKVQELAQADGQGDVETQDELLRELAQRARRKHGLS
ncbi:MAG: DNA primase, partial [Myxococcales bacterium]|nr:DNA primase [Myxococcales bacterium]